MLIKGFRIDESSDPRTGVRSILIRDIADLSPGGFDPDGTFMCGQCFRWKSIGDGRYAGIVGRKAVTVSLTGGRHLLIRNSTAEDFDSTWHRYFDLPTDYAPIVRAVSGDDFMREAASRCCGTRLLRQDFEETLFSYILSSQNNIPRISKLVEDLCARCGEPVAPPAGDPASFPGGHSFPDAQAIAGLLCRAGPQIPVGSAPGNLYAERPVGCAPGNLCETPFGGYRCPYMVKTARMLASCSFVPDPVRLASQPAALSRKELRALPGVGEKVADCVLLYSGIRTDICPVDTWIEKTMKSVYLGDKATAADIRRFAETRFGNHAGYAQLWMFRYVRSRAKAD